MKDVLKVAKFRIDGFDDRRKLAGLLADNGYSVTIESHSSSYQIPQTQFYVIVDIEKPESTIKIEE